MEVENMSSNYNKKEEEDDDVPLPGFRFHPTDEELVSFYLRRKVEKRPISIELIKQADIYKYDPWDLPKYSNGGEKEWYYFCRRGRKYKNSVRPNRVTSSGFWKATGIDRPIYSSSSRSECIGLKKSLVYYRGSAGKGAKTEWMMHEFRLPPQTSIHIAQEAEVWTLCRILKRSVNNAYRKCTPAADWREVVADHHNKRSNNNNIIIDNNPASIIFDASSETCSVVESCDQNGKSSYISFNYTQLAPSIAKRNDDQNKLSYSSHNIESIGNYLQHDENFPGHLISSSSLDVSSVEDHQAPCDIAASSFSRYNTYDEDINEFLRHADWEDLRSVVDYAAATTTTSNPSLYM